MHRVGVASVQLTRSTAAEATACRESLQPSALRARCNSQSSREFQCRQAVVDAIRRKLRVSCFLSDSSAAVKRARRHSGSELWVHAEMHRVRFTLVRPPDRPPPKRLPLGGPSTSGAPSSVQVGDYGEQGRPSSRSESGRSLFAIFPIQSGQTCVVPLVLYLNRTKDSPSRVRFRPLPRLTFRFRVRPSGRASS